MLRLPENAVRKDPIVSVVDKHDPKAVFEDLRLLREPYILLLLIIFFKISLDSRVISTLELKAPSHLIDRLTFDTNQLRFSNVSTKIGQIFTK